jgi:3-methylfumaryl-CoA hydratase
MPEIALQNLTSWIGRTERHSDVATESSVARLSAMLDRDGPALLSGADLPPLWHWIYFAPSARQSEIDVDGHPKRGGFLPPVPLPRRMWAGGRLTFLRPLHVGDGLVRESRIMDVKAKDGQSGALVFVTVRHDISDGDGLALIEEQDIVYREAAGPAATGPARQDAIRREEFSRDIRPDPVLLFRYSALTFNAHRIHYDRPYATAIEGYPGLVVHGPLIATLLLELLWREYPKVQVHKFAFKAVRPLFDLDPFKTCGRMDGERKAVLWACSHNNAIAMEATAEWGPT